MRLCDADYGAESFSLDADYDASAFSFYSLVYMEHTCLSLKQ